MLLLIEIALLIIALSLLIPIATLFIECSAALFPSAQLLNREQDAHPRIAVLVPAHNEATGIAATLQTLLPELTSQDQLVVIADNCDDETAAIARSLGVTVIERQNPELRGKGYALDRGLQFLASNPPEIIVMVDADCIVEPGTIEKIASLAATTTRPVQAAYLMQPPDHPSPKDGVSVLAFTIKNLVRPRGLARLGLPCLLTGSGMAFPWSLIQQVSLASSNLVEDMQLALDLAIAGHAPIFCPIARVTSLLPKQQHAARSQRTRWEHGHLRTLLTQVPRLLIAAVRQQRLDLLAISLDLVIPPLSLLITLWVTAIGIALFSHIWGTSWVPSILLGVEGGLMFSAILAAWFQFCRSQLPLGTLLATPLYILGKLPMYFSFLTKPQTKWIRTERDVIDLPDP
jgi:cellulose synthase/poly-beta-1,6-N-acetylglucosamine synthase-like glycosyltransferase